MRDDIITLVWPLSGGQEDKTDVFGRIESVSQSEFFAAAQNGLKPQYKVTLWEHDYNDQPIVIVNDKRYSVYRTYNRTDQKIELYLDGKIGVR